MQELKKEVKIVKFIDRRFSGVKKMWGSKNISGDFYTGLKQFWGKQRFRGKVKNLGVERNF